MKTKEEMLCDIGKSCAIIGALSRGDMIRNLPQDAIRELDTGLVSLFTKLILEFQEDYNQRQPKLVE